MTMDDRRPRRNGEEQAVDSERTTANHLLWVVLIIVSLLTLSTGCRGSDAAPIAVPTGAQAGDLVELTACTYKANKAEYAADCGTLVVPENRSDPGSRLIALPVVRVRATGGDPAEPIFKLGGGPGKSNMATGIVPWFIEHHDVVLVGYRGIDGSVMLSCPEVVKVMRSGSRDDLLSDAALDRTGAAYARCAERLRGAGIDLDGYTVTETIDDMEAARAGLGYERVNLLSDSFGTNVARIYAYAYPESIHLSAMIVADTPSATIHEPGVVDELIRRYGDLCAQDAKCSARTDDLTETMRDVSHNMPKRWLFLPVNAGLVKAGTYNLMERTTEAPMIVDTWLAAAEGDPSGMAMLTLLGPSMFAKASVWGHNASLRSSLGQFDPARDYRTELNPPDAIVGSPASTAAYAGYAAWPAKLIAEAYRQVQPSDVETLLVSGSVDFNTPAQYARDELLPSLSNGRQVILSEFGHGEFLSLQPEASKRLLASFYDTGVADDSLYTYHPVDFDVGLGYPAMAKLGLTAIVLVIAIVVATVWYIARRARRRKAGQVSS
jgi:pimeloyl-ACP methyl ester carboxylesterase